MFICRCEHAMFCVEILIYNVSLTHSCLYVHARTHARSLARTHARTHAHTHTENQNFSRVIEGRLVATTTAAGSAQAADDEDNDEDDSPAHPSSYTSHPSHLHLGHVTGLARVVVHAVRPTPGVQQHDRSVDIVDTVC